MKMITAHERTSKLIDCLINVWEKSVRKTHLFLSESEIEEIKKCIPQALQEITHLIIAEDENGLPCGFMGVENSKLEMLFISPEKRGNGIGKHFILYAVENFSVNKVTVNEQNPQAIGFYEHMGFTVYKRTDTDEQGRPYPLLYMKR